MAKVEINQSRRSYIVTENTGAQLFSYTRTKNNFTISGVLAPITIPGTGYLPAGRVLRENGRTLVPGINPGNVTTYMVGVYDNQLMISGFIDPNAPVFAIYNNDRPNFLVDNVDPGNGPVTTAGGTSLARLTDRGAPVLTNGCVNAATTVTAGLSLAAGTFLSTGTYASIGSYLTAETGISSVTGNITAVAGNLVAPLGKLAVNVTPGISSINNPVATNVSVTFSGNPAVGVVNISDAVNDGGGFRKIYVSTSACSSSSSVFLSYVDSISNPGALSVEEVNNGRFRIVSNNVLDRNRVQFFIVN